MKKRIISFLLAFVMVVGVLPVTASAAYIYGSLTGLNSYKTYSIHITEPSFLTIKEDESLTDFALCKSGDNWMTEYLACWGYVNNGKKYKLEPGYYTLAVYVNAAAAVDSVFDYDIYYNIEPIEPSHTCSFKFSKKVDPTCSAKGYDLYKCSCGETEKRNYKDKIAHTPAPGPYVAPTCGKDGKSGGMKCSACGTYTVAATVIPATGKHTEVLVKGKAANCTETGLTDGKKCSVCGKITVKQNTIPTNDKHNPISGEGKDPTCTETGMKDVKKCSRCAKILSFTTVPTLGGHELADMFCTRCGGGDPDIFTASGTEDNIKWGVDKEGYLRLYGSGEMNDYQKSTSERPPWWKVRDEIKYIVIEEGITYLSAWAFGDLVNATGIDIPGSVTSIGPLAFRNCSNFLEVNIPDSVELIDFRAFSGCERMVKITLPEGLKHTDINGTQDTFEECSSLVEVNLPNEWERLQGVFLNCTSLESMIIPKNVKAFGGFDGCTNLKTIYIQGEMKSVVPADMGGVKATVYYPEEASWLTKMHYPDANLIWVLYDPCEEHTFGPWEPKTEGSCTKPGTEISKCTGCEVTKIRVADGGYAHSWDSGVVTRQPTEELEGIRTLTCTLCKTKKTETIDKLEHNHILSKKEKKEPTCTEMGYTTFTCGCGYEEQRDEVKARGHDWDEGIITKVPTETAKGEKTYTCKTCGEKDTEEVSSLVHSHSYHAGWKYDAEGHWQTCACGEAGEKENHSAAKAQCGKTAICDDCGADFTMDGEHSNKVWYSPVYHFLGCENCGLRWGWALHTDADGDSVCDDYGCEIKDIPHGVLDDAFWYVDEDFLMITGSGKMRDKENASGYPWYPYRDHIRFVDVCGVSIGDHAFQGYKKLNTVSIWRDEYTLETVPSIGSQAFADSEELELVIVYEGVPVIAADAFQDVKASIDCYDYWEEDLRKDYGGDLTWYVNEESGDSSDDEVCISHTYGDWILRKDATCEQDGEKYRLCKCGSEDTEVIPAKGHNFQGGKCTRCGQKKAEGVTRLAGNSRYETSFAIANEMKKALGITKFDSIILANSDNFADALAGSYLAAVKEAPIIIAKRKYASLVCGYLNENLAEGGTVYILGGITAMPSSILAEMTVDYKPVRLAGNDRYATNLAILEKAGVAGKDILVATGQDFADSLSASATGLPILLVNGKPGKTLSEGQKALLAAVTGKIYIIGGESAVPESMVQQIETASGKTTERIAGGSRYETSVKIAGQFLGGAESAVVAYASTFPDGLCGGPLAYAVKAPLILVKDGKTEAPDYTTGNNITSGYVLGGDGLISDGFAGTIFGTVITGK